MLDRYWWRQFGNKRNQTSNSRSRIILLIRTNKRPWSFHSASDYGHMVQKSLGFYWAERGWDGRIHVQLSFPTVSNGRPVQAHCMLPQPLWICMSVGPAMFKRPCFLGFHHALLLPPLLNPQGRDLIKTVARDNGHF